jgi:hypothetical protein
MQPSEKMKKNAFWDRPETSIDMEIRADGRWYHEGSEIARSALVRLFASVLRRSDDGAYWLVTPAECSRIRVADAPFVITRLQHSGTGQTRRVTLFDNLDREFLLGPDHRLILRAGPQPGEARPYLELGNSIEALVSRPVFYELAELAENRGSQKAGLTSAGQFFELEL